MILEGEPPQFSQKICKPRSRQTRRSAPHRGTFGFFNIRGSWRIRGQLLERACIRRAESRADRVRSRPEISPSNDPSEANLLLWAIPVAHGPKRAMKAAAATAAMLSASQRASIPLASDLRIEGERYRIPPLYGS
jgi:hypothetical protein